MCWEVSPERWAGAECAGPEGSVVRLCSTHGQAWGADKGPLTL